MNYALNSIDYGLILGSVIVSLTVGLYYGFIKKKDNSAAEYFLASRQLSIFQIACSIFATIVSSGGIVGLPVEIYYYGMQPIFILIIFPISHYINMKFFFPIYYKIGSPDQLTYFELRFFKGIRYLLSTLNILDQTFQNSVVIYGAAVSLSSVFRIHVWLLVFIITTVCTVYSSLGGVRGVTVTDTIQGFMIMASVAAVIITGTIAAGGISVVWNRNWESGRLNIFNFDFDPKIRHTFWSATIGTFIDTMAIVTSSQVMIMRMMAGKSIKHSQRAMTYGNCLTSTVYASCACIGLIIYAIYYMCDPLLSGMIKNPNELISLLIGRQLSVYKGLAGVFFAGLLCAALSTVSSALNGVSPLIMETFVKPFNVFKNEATYTKVAKLSVFAQGILILIGMLLIEQFPNVYQAQFVIMAVTNGPRLALLLIGMFFPQAKAKLAVGAFSFGLLFMIWVVIGSLLVHPNFRPFPISTEGCELFTPNVTHIDLLTNPSSTVNKTFAINSTISETDQLITKVPTYWANYFPLSSISFTWFSLLSVMVTLATFGLLSITLGSEKTNTIDTKLIPEQFQSFHKRLNKKWRKRWLCDIYDDKETTEQESEPLRPITT
ncbi:hypothetical protein CHUAL_003387 [Chamberlinius hualienensis]